MWPEATRFSAAVIEYAARLRAESGLTDEQIASRLYVTVQALVYSPMAVSRAPELPQHESSTGDSTSV